MEHLKFGRSIEMETAAVKMVRPDFIWAGVPFALRFVCITGEPTAAAATEMSIQNGQ
jgi:hypothetical protein